MREGSKKVGVKCGMTVSKPTKTKGDAVTGRITGRGKCVCMSANTVCHKLTVRFLGLKVSPGSARGVVRTYGSIRMAVNCRDKVRRVCMGKRGIATGLHARRIKGVTSVASTVPRIERGLLRLREALTERGSIVVSKESVNARILPSTSMGVCLATDMRVETGEECGRLIRGKMRYSLGRVRGSVRRESCHSVAEGVTPLGGTRSTVLISDSSVALGRIMGAVSECYREWVYED